MRESNRGGFRGNDNANFSSFIHYSDDLRSAKVIAARHIRDEIGRPPG